MKNRLILYLREVLGHIGKMFITVIPYMRFPSDYALKGLGSTNHKDIGTLYTILKKFFSKEKIGEIMGKTFKFLIEQVLIMGIIGPIIEWGAAILSLIGMGLLKYVTWLGNRYIAFMVMIFTSKFMLEWRDENFIGAIQELIRLGWRHMLAPTLLVILYAEIRIEQKFTVHLVLPQVEYTIINLIIVALLFTLLRGTMKPATVILKVSCLLIALLHIWTLRVGLNCYDLIAFRDSIPVIDLRYLGIDFSIELERLSYSKTYIGRYTHNELWKLGIDYFTDLSPRDRRRLENCKTPHRVDMMLYFIQQAAERRMAKDAQEDSTFFLDFLDMLVNNKESTVRVARFIGFALLFLLVLAINDTPAADVAARPPLRIEWDRGFTITI